MCENKVLEILEMVFVETHHSQSGISYRGHKNGWTTLDCVRRLEVCSLIEENVNPGGIPFVLYLSYENREICIIKMFIATSCVLHKRT